MFIYTSHQLDKITMLHEVIDLDDGDNFKTEISLNIF